MIGLSGDILNNPEPVDSGSLEALDRLLSGLPAESLYWLAGYVHARARHSQPSSEAAAPALPASNPAARLTVIYGSQTGNAKRVAEALVARAQAEGLAVRLLRADAYPQRELADERALLFAISTQGDGDPPDDARSLLRFLHGPRAPRLPQLRYGVIGLGDSSYPKFCAIGIELDARLEALGAQRLAPRADADVDIDHVATPFVRNSIDAAKLLLDAVAPRAKVTPLRPLPVSYSRQRPFAAAVLANQRICASDSELRIHHLELDLRGSGLRYQPGDALGVWPQQDPELLARVLDLAQLDGSALVKYGDVERPLVEWLGQHRELTRLSRASVQALAQKANDDALAALLADASSASAWLQNHQLIDVLERFAPRLNAADWVALLPALQPRLYSIASSARAVGEEVHLTVAEQVSAVGADLRYGVASRHLLSLAEGARVPVYVESNERFRLPANPDRDLIMIGPGTGVAPFRGFVQERAEVGARGRHWLLFGHRHLRREFLYQTEWLAALADGRLARLDVAFSRDQPQRRYVQHLLRERARELVEWLDGGAHLYVCGDATRMAKDVHQALVEILVAVRGIDADAANDELDRLADAGRYARDVY